MAFSTRIGPGTKLYSESILGGRTGAINGSQLARIYVESANTTFVLIDIIQPPESITGKSGSFPITGQPIVHNPPDLSTSAPNIDNIDVYHSFSWFGLRNGFLVLELFDGRPVTGVSWGTLTHLTLTSSIPVPVGRCSHVASVSTWANANGAIGTIKLYIDGVEVASGTTNANTGMGTGNFYLDFASFTLGTSIDNYYPANGFVRVMDLRAGVTPYSAAQILTEAQDFCRAPLVPGGFNYPLSQSLDEAVPDPNTTLVIQSGSISDTPHCCPPPVTPQPDPDAPIPSGMDVSGIYFTAPTSTTDPGPGPGFPSRHDVLYDRNVPPTAAGSIARKIPNPTMRTALFGE